MRTYEQYEKEILKVIKKRNIFTLEMIFTFYSGISRGHFYEIKLNKSDALKKATDDNKNRTKQSMLNKWYNSENATLQIALMKLIATEQEAERLNGSKIKTELSGSVPLNFTVEVVEPE